MTAYLPLPAVLMIHARQIAQFGGASGIRDEGLLRSALSRPQSGYYQDLFEEAAALWESLAQNHPFIDGNKRVAFAATYVFLHINGQRIIAEPDDAYAFIIGLYESGRFRYEFLLAWLKANTKPA